MTDLAGGKPSKAVPFQAKPGMVLEYERRHNPIQATFLPRRAY